MSLLLAFNFVSYFISTTLNVQEYAHFVVVVNHVLVYIIFWIWYVLNNKAIDFEREKY